ncbi:MAG: nitroreductase family protein [Gammaproteobacteria bacterium]|jgi:nitroreductase
MELFEAMFTRRSVRKFLPTPVPAEIIEKILRAAMSAPSASDGRPWHFVVIDDRAKLDSVPEFHPYAQMFLGAPMAIVPCADISSTAKNPAFWQQDMAAATQNILLAVRALGLGAVWVSAFPREDRVAGLRKMLNLPDHIFPLNIIPLGYTDVEQVAADRFDKTRIHHNGW